MRWWNDAWIFECNVNHTKYLCDSTQTTQSFCIVTNFWVIVFVFPSQRQKWWSPDFLEMDEHLPAHGKYLINSISFSFTYYTVFNSSHEFSHFYSSHCLPNLPGEGKLVWFVVHSLNHNKGKDKALLNRVYLACLQGKSHKRFKNICIFFPAQCTAVCDLKSQSQHHSYLFNNGHLCKKSKLWQMTDM